MARTARGSAAPPSNGAALAGCGGDGVARALRLRGFLDEDDRDHGGGGIYRQSRVRLVSTPGLAGHRYGQQGAGMACRGEFPPLRPA
jgi:hypothetical protein